MPLPIFTLFHDEARVRQMLRERAKELRATLERVGAGEEYGLRIFRLDDALGRHVSTLRPHVGALERQAREANPGQRYLLERKLDTERRKEVKRIAADLAREAFEALAPLALEAVLGHCREGQGTTTVVSPCSMHSFCQARKSRAVPAIAQDIVREHEPTIHFDFTGPWPRTTSCESARTRGRTDRSAVGPGAKRSSCGGLLSHVLEKGAGSRRWIIAVPESISSPQPVGDHHSLETWSEERGLSGSLHALGDILYLRNLTRVRLRVSWGSTCAGARSISRIERG